MLLPLIQNPKYHIKNKHKIPTILFPTKFNGMGLSEVNVVYTLFKQKNEKVMKKLIAFSYGLTP